MCTNADCIELEKMQAELGFGDVRHASTCPKATKCVHCRARTDIDPVQHSTDCPKATKCIDCRTRTDIYPVQHAVTCRSRIGNNVCD